MLSRALVTVWKYDPATEARAASTIEVRLPARVGAQLGMALSSQVMVLGVTEGGLAEGAGLRPWDFIERVDGEPVANLRFTMDLDLRVSQAASRRAELKLTVGHWKPVPPSSGGTISFIPRTEVILVPR